MWHLAVEWNGTLLNISSVKNMLAMQTFANFCRNCYLHDRYRDMPMFLEGMSRLSAHVPWLRAHAGSNRGPSGYPDSAVGASNRAQLESCAIRMRGGLPVDVNCQHMFCWKICSFGSHIGLLRYVLETHSS